ncbi:ThiF family adenylyltransferase [Streptomyces sp. NPDC020951]|uniref:ThiF family adenylyltransferase n=1 Tax=Streptomyces sp. NPDC020951 TaxID=3365104 RepID=UPI0037A9AC00
MSERTSTAITAGQQLALDQLRQITGSERGGVFLTHVDRAPAKAPTGFVEARISVGCAGLPSAQGGLRLRSEEPVTLYIPPDFPFKVPLAYTRHTRFADAPHVVWVRFPCLYRSEATEWDPADGMYGFITRLLDWFKAAAAGELDAPGEPLHPPHAVGDYADGLLVVRRNAPVAEDDKPWLGAALLHHVNADRSDVVGWLPFGQPWPDTLTEARAAARLPDDTEMFLAPAVITADHLTFEYPSTARALIKALARGRITARMVLGLVGMVADHNRRLRSPADQTEPDGTSHPSAPVHLLFGTPSRGTTGDGPRRTHLVAWHLPDFAGKLTRRAVTAYVDRQLPELGDEIMQIGEEWLDTLTTRWISLYEARPEVTVRRDHHTPAAWLRGKRILVLGAGALGAPTADICARAGAARITVVDSAAVHPGIHARQPYTDMDIGYLKADVLAGRLNQIDPHTTRIEPVTADITRCLTALDVHSFDLILDCTANRVVRAYLERARRTDPTLWPHLATLMIGHHATRGIAALSPRGTTGGGTDVLRRTALAARTDPTGALTALAEDFFPTEPRTELFQPEPGCSDATFTGSAADVTALAGQLMTGILHALNAPADQHTMAALTVRTPSGPTDTQPAGPRWLTWPNDTTTTDDATGYEVRIAPAALAEMRAEARRGARVRGPRVETGGMLLGAIDDSTGIIHVDEATGPPPDSLLTETYFQHGLDGVTRHLATRRRATGNTSRFLGLWHTHPHTPAQPSATDRTAMELLTLPLDDAPARALVLIAGGPQPVWQKWLTTADGPDLYARLATRTTTATTPPAVQAPPSRPGPAIWWPGGYATRPAPADSPLPAPRRSDDARP